jgi:hypothetical protein
MLTFVYNSCKRLPHNFWYVFGAFLGISSITTPIAIAYLVVNSNGIVYKAGETEINLKGKELRAVNDENINKLETQLEIQNQKILQLTQAAKAKKLEGKLPELKEVEQASKEAELRLEDVTNSSNDLQDFVEAEIES